MSGAKTLSSFGVGLGVFGGWLVWSISRPIGYGLSFRVLPLVSSSVHLPFVVVVAVVDAVCGAW